jgi:hypothetical protein
MLLAFQQVTDCNISITMTSYLFFKEQFLLLNASRVLQIVENNGIEPMTS